VLVNMVMSVDGKAVVDGDERGLGSDTDRRLMRELRVNADIVMSGAGTMRATGISPRLGSPELEAVRVARGKPKTPIGAVLSASGDLPLGRLFFTGDFEAVVYLGADVAPDQRAAIVATGRRVVGLPARDEIPAMLSHMRHELRAEVLLVEGGPGLNAQLFALGFVDEYFTTIGPVVVGGRETATPVEGPRSLPVSELPRLDLLAAVPNPETDEVYLRYRVRRA
jgi:riboflavin biosynthesis pyrimidine reductase